MQLRLKIPSLLRTMVQFQFDAASGLLIVCLATSKFGAVQW
jgi:hypothetical protein